MKFGWGLKDNKQEAFPEGNLTLTEKLAWLRLIRTENIGPITFYRLIENYGNVQTAIEALPGLSARGGRKKPLIAPPVATIEKEYAALQKLGGDVITALCADYPIALSAIDDAPPVISVLGNRDMMKPSCIAMVGARNASLNGRKLASKLSRDLGMREQIVVSGLARGIDTAAHEGALETGTIAVVAGGVDVVYPEENRKLYEDIKERGLIIAESPLGTQPIARHFPRRNRIVSGLSKAVIVVEATMKSGSLITARMAGEQGRDVMAVPGSPLDPRAAGPNALLRDGATLIRNADDIMETLRDFSGNTLREIAPPDQSFEHGMADPDHVPENAHHDILEQLSFTPVTVDELIRACHLSIPVLQTVLLELELAGRIKRYSGGRVSLLD